MMQDKFDEKLKELINKDLCLAVTNFSRDFPQVIFNMENKDGKFVTFHVEPSMGNLFCYEEKETPAKSYKDLRSRKHVAIDNELTELIRNSKVLEELYEKYADYCKRTGHEIPDYTVEGWKETLKKVDSKANNEQAKRGA